MERARMRSSAVVVAVVLAILWPVGAGTAGAAAGSTDQGFGAGGVVQTHLTDLDGSLDLLIQPDGKSVTIGVVDGGDGVLLRHLADGTLDPTFGTGGIVRGSPGASFFRAGALQPDGKIVVVGSNFSTDEVVVLRYLASGAPDPGFGAGGVVATDFGQGDDGLSLALQTDGKIVVGGRSGEAIALARYLPHGSLDPDFGTGGKRTTAFGPTGTSAEATAIAILSSGAVVVGGRVVTQAGLSMLLARYTPGGDLDGTFGAGGRVAAADERLTRISSLVVQSGDRVVAAGTTSQGQLPVQGLARYLANGSLDPAFGTAGSTSSPLGPETTAEDLAVDPTGRLVTVGSLHHPDGDSEPGGFSFVLVSRWSADGLVDGTFGCAGSTQVELTAEVGGRATGIAIAADGKILVGGIAFTDGNTNLGRPDFLLVRVLADGATGTGYWITRSDGSVTPFGSAGGCGSLRGLRLATPVVAHAGRASGDGYWLVATDGGVFSFGDAPFLGSASGLPLSHGMVGMARTPSGDGYWLLASDGGIFTYGDAGFFGSTGGMQLNLPIVGMAATPSGDGYWLVASDGGIFAFGDAGFFGSTGGMRLNRPVVGMAATPSGDGYWLVASDGGVFAFGEAGFFGSTGGIPLNQPVVGMAGTASAGGYWLTASDGGIFAFGDAPFLGSTGGQPFPGAGVAITRQG